MSRLELRRLSYAYPHTSAAALRTVDLDVDGGLTLVAGPSGGGKSTLLRLSNGLVPHFHGGRISGSARSCDHDVFSTSTRQLAGHVGFVFQDPEHQAVRSTVAADVAFALENAGVAPAEMRRRVHESLDALAIGHLSRRRLTTLSGGERQRVAIAGAMVAEPRLLVVDEPLSQLDPNGVTQVVDACIRLRQRGAAVLIAEHRLDELLPRADSVILVKGGEASAPQGAAEIAGLLPDPPQVVALGKRMDWRPTPLDVESARRQLSPDSRTSQATVRPRRATVWRFHDVSVAVGGRTILEAVDIEGGAGEVTLIMGANGSGKTTLLRALAGFLRPQQGGIERPPGRVTYLPQNPAAVLHRATIRDEVMVTLRHTGGGADPSDVLTPLGLAGLADSSPHDLSSGQRQRAAVAAVTAGDAVMVLLDEPTRGMDASARRAMAALIRRLAGGGAAVVVATHDAELAAMVGDRIVHVHSGSARDAGPPAAAMAALPQLATQMARLLPGVACTVDDAVMHLRGAAAKR